MRATHGSPPILGALSLTGRLEAGLVFTFTLAWLALLAGLRTLNLPDEGRYVGVAWEMLVSGQWLTPTLDGLPFFHKPPLFYWLSAGAMALFGASSGMGRSPSLLAAAVAATVFFVVLKEWYGIRIARLATLALATLPLFYAGAQFGNMDLLVASCIAVSVLLGARAALRFEAGAPWRGAVTGAWFAAALGVLAKGLIGAVLPGLVLFLWLAMGRRWRPIAALAWPPALLLFLATALPWFLWMEHVHPGFLHYFIVVQHFQRFSGTGFNNVAPFWFYVPVLLVLALPWSAWLFARRREAVGTSGADPIRRLMWTWLIVIAVFFSLPQSKLIGYIIPCTFPLAALAALSAAPRLGRGRRTDGLWKLSGAVAALLCITLVVAVARSHPASTRRLALDLDRYRPDGDPIAFLGDYWYDLPFYLREGGPSVVLTDWRASDLQRSDDWRNELLDAGSFDAERANERLQSTDRLVPLICEGRIHWVVVHRADLSRYPALRHAPVAVEDRRELVLHTDARNPDLAALLGCTPSGSSGG